MPLYTHNGSIPTEIPPGVSEEEHIANGWKIAPDKPECPEGKEVVWYSHFWIIRDPQPADEPGYSYAWNQDNTMWMKFFVPQNANTDDKVYVAAYADYIKVSNTEAKEYILNIQNPSVSEINIIPTLTSTSISGLTSTSISALTSTSIQSL